MPRTSSEYEGCYFCRIRLKMILFMGVFLSMLSMKQISVSSHSRSESGLSLLELVVTVGILTLVVGSIATAMTGTQSVFLESQLISRLHMRARRAMDRIVSLSSQAMTTDSRFTPQKSNTGVNSHCLRFRLMQSIDPVTGDAVYDDLDRIFIYGPHGGGQPNRGIIIGRGRTLGQIYRRGRGPDGFLGTTDDNTRATITPGFPAVELLIPATFAPSSGDMFRVNVTPAPIGRLLTFTLRINARGTDGNFILPTDFTLVQRVALRQ